MSHKEKVVLVTGASRGIGLAICQYFKEKNWKVIACSKNIQKISDHPSDFKFNCDVGNVQEVKKNIQLAKEKFPTIDALINNAGLAGSNSLDPEVSDQLWHEILNVNLNGTYYMCKYVAPYFPKEGGRIINIASVLGLKGVPDASAYCAAKHGVIGLTRSLAHYFAQKKITVNAICPGWVRTDMAAGRLDEIGLSEAQMSRGVPLGRFVEPNEIADFAYFLANSPASSMITGQALTIDGGVLA